MTERPLWRRLYDDVERAVAPQVEGLVRSDGFAEATAFVTKAQSAVRDQIQGATTRVWHLFNLPTATDVQRLRGQMGALDREVRRLSLRLEQQAGAPASPGSAAPDRNAPERAEVPVERPAGKVTDDADIAESDERARPGASRGRAKRPPRS